MKAAWKVVSLVVVAVGVVGCVKPVLQDVRLAPYSEYVRREAGFTPREQEWLDDNCPAGLPSKVSEWPHGPTHYVVREGYALEHSCLDRIALWVCERVTPEELGEGASRRDRFRADPELDAACRAELVDYRRSGFDRGHQAPAGNQSASQRLNDETFFLSNMAPQVGVGFNRQAWRLLEQLARDWVEDGVVPSAHIITGGFFYDPEEESVETADGVILHERIGDNAVAVPTHFYKIVAARDDEGTWRVVGFVMENRQYGSIDDFSRLIRPVRWIEERTGIDFMPDLGPVEGPELEGAPGTLFEAAGGTE